MNFLSLFSGGGGFDRGLESAGLRCVGQVERDADCRRILARHWPGMWRWRDVTTLTPEIIREHCGEPDVIAGGDPCPKHSRARSNGESAHPDLSGYFLALAGGCLPEWLVRENVPAPTVDHFAACLDAIGYGTVVIRADAAEATGQSRQRDFVVGRLATTALDLRRTIFAECEDGPGAYTTRFGTREVTPALTTHRTRYDSRDCYVFNAHYGLRILESEERETLAGLPKGWTAGLSPAARARVCGNAVVTDVAEWIGRRILATSAPSPAPAPATTRKAGEA